MNPLDIGVVAVVLLSALFAFARGFVREALSIIAWVGAAAFTIYEFNAAFALIDPMVHNPLLSQLIAGFGLFIVSLIVLTILTGMAARFVRGSAMSPIDRTLGFIFGLARGAFLVCLAYLLLDVSVQPGDRPVWIREARSAPYLRDGAEMLRSVLPESLRMKSTAIGGDSDSPSPAAEARRAMRALATPGPARLPDKPAEAPAPPPGYKPGERRGLDRLIGNQP